MQNSENFSAPTKPRQGDQLIHQCYSVNAQWSDLVPKEGVALLLNVVVDDSQHFALPYFKTVDVDIVLDVLKRPSETVHYRSKSLKLWHQFTRLHQAINFIKCTKQYTLFNAPSNKL